MYLVIYSLYLENHTFYGESDVLLMPPPPIDVQYIHSNLFICLQLTTI